MSSLLDRAKKLYNDNCNDIRKYRFVIMTKAENIVNIKDDENECITVVNFYYD